MPRKIIYQCAVSLDGYIEDREGRFDWCLTDFGYDMQAFIDSIDTYLYGRKTYELIIKMGETFDPAKRHVVFAGALSLLEPHCEWVPGSAADWVREMVKEEGKNIWLMGGATLAGSLAEAGLVDELQLAVHPVVLGGGKPLFEGLQKRLAYFPSDIRSFENGVTMMTYHFKGDSVGPI